MQKDTMNNINEYQICKIYLFLSYTGRLNELVFLYKTSSYFVQKCTNWIDVCKYGLQTKNNCLAPVSL